MVDFRKYSIVIVFAITFLFVGCGKKADPLVLPEQNTISEINIETENGYQYNIIDSEHIDDIMTVLNDAEPTRRQSVNDQPTEEFGTISIISENNPTTLYYYEDDGKYYVESPYVGIYELASTWENVIREED